MDPTDVVVEDEPSRKGKWSPQTGEEDVDEEYGNSCLRCIGDTHESFFSTCAKHKTMIIRIVLIVLLILYFCYFGYAMYYEQLSNEQSVRLCWVTCVVVFFILLHFFMKFCGKSVKKAVEPVTKKISKHHEMVSW